jgi:hypothetical protein
MQRHADGAEHRAATPGTVERVGTGFGILRFSFYVRQAYGKSLQPLDRHQAGDRVAILGIEAVDRMRHGVEAAGHAHRGRQAQRQCRVVDHDLGQDCEGAAPLGLAQPAVSRTLSMLEKRLGEPLFIKGRRPLQPTPLGLSLAEHGLVMLATSRKASDLVDGSRIGKSGIVRVGGTPFFMDALIAGMCAEFQAHHPDVRIDQTSGYFPDLRAALKADQIDLAICPIDILDEGSGLEFQQILPGRNVIACRVAHPLLLKRRPQPAHVLDYPLVAPPPGSPLLADLREMLLSFGATEIRSAIPAARS